MAAEPQGKLPSEKASRLSMPDGAAPAGSWPAALVLAVPFAILAAGVVAGVARGGWYTWLVREDGAAENLQVLALAVAAAGAVALARRWLVRQSLVRALVWAGAAAALLFVAGEEISWGQRIVGWETPARLAEVNRQAESNVHNVVGVETLFRIAQMTMLVVCGLGPLVLGARRRRPPAWLPLPPPIVTPYFLLPFAGVLVGLAFEPPAPYVFAWRESAELMELIVYLGFALTVAAHWQAARRP